MAMSKWATVTMSRGDDIGTACRFFESKESAFEHAQRVAKDLDRYAYVMRVESSHVRGITGQVIRQYPSPVDRSADIVPIFRAGGYIFWRDNRDSMWNATPETLDVPPTHCGYASPEAIAALKGVHLRSVKWESAK